jgi:hypothetical protein
MSESINEGKQIGMALLGAVVGGVLGYFTFFWLVHQGFYGMIVPGGFIGLGAGLGRTRHAAVAVVCAIAAVGLGIFCEWRFAPFIADGSFGYFAQHLHELKPLTLIMIMAGAALAFWIPFQRCRR